MKKGRWLIAAFIFLAFLSGCLKESITLTVPPSGTDIDQAAEISLKQLDLTRLSKTKITDISGVALPDRANGYEIQYRHPDEPVNITVAKLPDAEAGKKFWEQWTETIQQRNNDLPSPGKLPEGGGYWIYQDRRASVIAWKKDVWFISVSIPVSISNPDRLRDKVRDAVVQHFNALAKAESA